MEAGMNPLPNDFDHLLDHALTTYTEAEPRLGLEQRILHQVAAKTSPDRAIDREWTGSRWAWLTVAISAAMLATILIYPHARPSSANTASIGPNPPAPHRNTSIAPQTEVQTADTHRLSATHPDFHRVSRPALSEPTREPDIAPLELTPQEKLLAQFVSTHRNEALTIARIQAHLDRPIAVPALEVQPIQLSPIADHPIVIAPLKMDSVALDSKLPTNL
jgi:hypothetical protein